MSSILSKTFTVGLSDEPETVSRAARRVIFNADILRDTKICSGDIVAISDGDGTQATGWKEFAVGIAWPSLNLSEDSVLVSSSLLLTARLQVGAQARIFPLSGIASSSKLPPGLPSLRIIQEAGTIQLKELAADVNTLSCPTGSAHEKKRDWLSLLLREFLVDLKYLTNTQTLEVVYEGQKRRFSVSSVSAQRPRSESVADLAENFHELSISSPQLWTVGWDSSVFILQNEVHGKTRTPKPKVDVLAPSSPSEAYASVGGLNKQVAQIRDLLEIPLIRPELFRHFGLKPPRGVLLHGPPGTGKTHLARAIASSTNSSVLVINGPELSSAYHGETESKLRDVFKEAHEKSPCIVVLDEVDAIVPRREEGTGGEVEKRVVATLLTILDGMDDNGGVDGQKDRVVVIGTTNRPNAIDPALRRPGRFDREIEIGIPDAAARLSILDIMLSKTPHNVSRDGLRDIASRAHGYVGADLSAVVREAGTIAIKRWLATHSDSPFDTSSKKPVLTLADLEASLPSVRPSAMRSLFIEIPPIRYSDIGGQAPVIQKLREAVEWPLLHSDAFSRLGVKPPKGVLLYGPPGCSKTVLARACACESGVNFVAVRGPELLNKYVGESERAVREIFRKARAASPSIIFFDEIDALAISRASSAAGEDTMGSSHEGVLTSLLNEMDGVQELLGVTVIAATNRPNALDSALMRPGRLDRILYVGPPDQSGREEILRIFMRKMNVEPGVDVAEIASLTEGCSGAELASLCREAALLAMKHNMDAPHVPHLAFISAAKATKRQITPSVLENFERWRERSGLRNL